MQYRATCVEIRAEDGAQKFELVGAPEHNRIVWLTGISRFPSTRVGDVGTMSFITTRTWGGFTFYPDKESAQ